MLLSAEQLSINFGSRQLLQDVDFYLNEGDKTGVIGINGTGKSTFLKVLAGLVQPDSGHISRRPNLQVSYLPQNPEMDDDRTILEQVFASMPPQFRALNEYEAKAMLTKLARPRRDGPAHRHALRRRTPPRGFVCGAHPSGGRAGARRADEPP